MTEAPLCSLQDEFACPVCSKHQKSLEKFCKTDDTCICMMCEVTEHKNHEMVQLETEREEKQKQLGVKLSEIRRRLDEKEKELECEKVMVELTKVLKYDFPCNLRKLREEILNNKSVEREVVENEQKFIDLICHTEEVWKKLIEEERKRVIKNAEGVLEQLQKEIEDLKKRDAELKEILDNKDHVHFLQTFSSLCVLPADGSLTNFTLTFDFSSEDLKKQLSFLHKCLEKIERWDNTTLQSGRVVLQPPEPPREEFLQYFCQLTLDINSANEWLSLSEGNKKLTRLMTKTTYPDHPDRFDCCPHVLCREALTGACYYWEVEWSGEFMTIGVTYKGLSRKGDGWECCIGFNDKSWSLQWFNPLYSVCHDNKKSFLNPPYSRRIGVFLDWPAGTLSFYSVSWKMTLLYRFKTTFTEPLYPAFGLLGCSGSSITICPQRP